MSEVTDVPGYKPLKERPVESGMPGAIDVPDEDRFEIHARGPQSWEVVHAIVKGGRLFIVIDGRRILKLTRIQSEEFSKWLERST